MPKLKNIIIFVGIGAALILVYVFFFRPSAPTPSLVSSTDITDTTTAVSPDAAANSAVAQNFLSTLLSVNSIKLDTTILSDPAFTSLHDSSVSLVPDPNPGRPNPFAQFGNDATSTTTTTTTTTPLATTNADTTTATNNSPAAMPAGIAPSLPPTKPTTTTKTN